MPRLLLIESSPTLRRGIERLLVQAGFEASAAPATASAPTALEQALAQGVAAVVLGWTASTDEICSALVQRLLQPDAAEVALLVLSGRRTQVLAEGLATRARTRLRPLAAPEAVPALVTELLSAPEPAPVPSRALKILLVDDSRTSRTKYRKLLQGLGHAVTTCEDATRALAAVQSERFDLGIVDYFMPGMNGAELCRALRALPATRELTLAVLTGSYEDELIHDCLQAGAIECMFKDEASELFLARVQSMARLREREIKLGEERQRLALILASVGEGVYGVDRAGRITFVNEAALRSLRYATAQELVGQPAHERFHHADAQGRPVSPDTCFLQQAYELGDSLSNWDTVFWCADGQALSVECNVRPQFRDGECIGVVVAFRDIAERKRFEAEMQWQLRHDHLTKLLNRRYFEELLEQETLRLRRSAEGSALLFIDLDRFKQINDTAGHAAGDALLAMIGQRLLSRARQSDAVARLAGDEFAVLLRNVDEHKVQALAETYRSILDDTRFVHAGREFDVSGSVGIVQLDRHTPSAAYAMNCADAACHVAKQAGRNRIHRFDLRDDAGAVAALQQSWSERLRRALDANAFALQFQPIVDLQRLGPGHDVAAACCGHEVFLRLDDLGTRLEPRAFLSQAERFNLLPALDTWVLERVAGRLQRAPAGVRFHVNVAAASLLDADYVGALAGHAAQGLFAQGRLSLELKESELTLHFAQLMPALKHIAALGVPLVLDEFGRGLGSLEHLRTLPIVAVKLDRTLVQGMSRDPFGSALVSTMTGLAHAMSLRVIAPGVEDEATVQLLQGAQLDCAQGYAFGRPSAECVAS